MTVTCAARTLCSAQKRSISPTRSLPVSSRPTKPRPALSSWNPGGMVRSFLLEVLEAGNDRQRGGDARGIEAGQCRNAHAGQDDGDEKRPRQPDARVELGRGATHERECDDQPN